MNCLGFLGFEIVAEFLDRFDCNRWIHSFVERAEEHVDFRLDQKQASTILEGTDEHEATETFALTSLA